MNLLVVDAGNSRCKYCLGTMDQAFPVESHCVVSVKDIGKHFDQMSPIEGCILSSVDASATDEITKNLARHLPSERIIFLSAENSPLKLLVDHPASLGTDRIAAAYGAWRKTQTQTIIIDCGTATTVDLVDGNGDFIGGTIFAGIQLSVDALARETDQLPQLDASFDNAPELLGRSTSSAIRSGVFWSQVGGVERIISNLQDQFGESVILATGGQGRAVLEASDLKGSYSPTLVLEGLWHFGIDRLV